MQFNLDNGVVGDRVYERNVALSEETLWRNEILIELKFVFGHQISIYVLVL